METSKCRDTKTAKRNGMIISKQDLLNLLGEEKLRVELAMIIAKGNVPKAAKIINVTERTIYRKLIDYDIKLEDYVRSVVK